MSARSLGLTISPDADKDSQIVNYNQVRRLYTSRARVSLTFLSTNFRFQLFLGPSLENSKNQPRQKIWEEPVKEIFADISKK